MAIILDGTAGITSGPISGTTGSFSGDVLLGSSVLATPAGSAPSYTCRAWVNFNGTGTVAIRASGNVSSITDHGVGDYTLNFATSLPVNFSSTALARGPLVLTYCAIKQLGTYTQSAVNLVTTNSAGSLIDADIVVFAAFA